MAEPIQRPRVAVVGQGRLHAAIVRALREHCEPVGEPDGCAAIVVASDTAETHGAHGVKRANGVNGANPYRATARHAARHRTPWLPVRIDGGWVLAGPAVRAGIPGCPTCVARRRSLNRPDAAERDALRAAFGAELAVRPSGLLTGVLVKAVAAVVAADVDRLLHRGTAWTDRALVRVAVPTGAVRRHTFLADPWCPDCGDRPPDGPRAGRLPLGPAPKRHPGAFRIGELRGRAAELERRYVDPETGVVQSVGADAQGGGLIAVARLGPGRDPHDTHHGYGQSGDFAATRATAVVEALERMAGLSPRGRRTVVKAAYADIAGHALDPRSLGLYPDDWYDQPEFWFTRFTPDKVTAWVWGYSLARDEPVLVPESYTFYGPRPKGDPAFAYETSNGCAMGGSMTEAVLHGLLEIAERDAFLVTWYARLPIPRVDLDSAADRRIPMIAERIASRLGYEVTAFAATLEQDLPVLWVTAVDRDRDPARPVSMSASAAHLDPEQALRRVLEELGPTLYGHLRKYDPEHAGRLAADSALVQDLNDHPILYGHPGAFERMRFLPFDGPAVPVEELRTRLGWPVHDDLADDLAELAGRYLASGLDVITVDTTSPEARESGLVSAKVIVPGAVPMTFGHRYRRVHGLPRLLSLPRRLGFRDRDLRPDELSPYPHPFP